MARLLSGKVKVTPYAGLSTDRYEFIQLSETEPNAGLPSVDGHVLASDTNGNRFWRSAPGASAINGITVKEEGSIVGTADSVSSLNFVSGNLTATASGVGATITLTDNPQFTNIGATLVTSTSGIVTHLTSTNANVTGIATISGLKYPISDGGPGQVLQTDGSGVLSFASLTGGSDEHILPVMTRTAQANSKNDAVMVTILAGINTVTGRFGSNVNVTENALVPFRETVGITTHSLIDTFFNTVV